MSKAVRARRTGGAGATGDGMDSAIAAVNARVRAAEARARATCDLSDVTKTLSNVGPALVHLFADCVALPSPIAVTPVPLTSPSGMIPAGIYAQTVTNMRVFRLVAEIEAMIGTPLKTPIDSYNFEDSGEEWIAQQADPETNEVDLVGLVVALIVSCEALATDRAYPRLLRLLSVVRELRHRAYHTDLWAMKLLGSIDLDKRPASLETMLEKAAAQGATPTELSMLPGVISRELDHAFEEHARAEIHRLTVEKRWSDDDWLTDMFDGFARQQTVTGELNARRREALVSLGQEVEAAFAELGFPALRVARDIWWHTMNNARATRVMVVAHEGIGRFFIPVGSFMCARFA